MNILSAWLREYLPALEISDRQLAEDLTLRGIAVEGVHELPSGGHLFEMDITTNRVDAMNHYGIAREAAAIYGVPLLTLEDRRVANAEGLTAAVPESGAGYPVRIEARDLCGRFTAQVVRGVSVGASTGVVAESKVGRLKKPSDSSCKGLSRSIRAASGSEKSTMLT